MVKTEYSVQDVADFTNPEQRRRINKPGHYCYPWYTHSGLEYVRRAGVQRAEDQQFRVDQCKKNVAPRDPLSRLSYIQKTVPLKSIEEALTVLHEHPVAAAIPIFDPEYGAIGNKIYRGPTSSISKFTAMHAVNIIGAGEENGEAYVLVRSSHGEEIVIHGNLKVSIEMIFSCLSPGSEFGKCPEPLIDGFVYPETSPESSIIKVDHSEIIINID